MRFWILSVLVLLTGVCSVSEAPAGSVTAPPRTPALPFSLSDLQGKTRTLSGEKGRVVLVNFWATWCGPCRVELPHLEKLHQKYKKAVTLFTIAVDDAQTAGGVKAMAASLGLTLPVLMDTDNAVVGKYDPQGIIPFTVLIDRKQNVRFVHNGYQAGDEKQVESELLILIKE